MSKSKEYASVHRFHDQVAIYVGTGETVYLAAHEADQLGKALVRFAKDTKNNTFQESQLHTFRMIEG